MFFSLPPLHHPQAHTLSHSVIFILSPDPPEQHPFYAPGTPNLQIKHCMTIYEVDKLDAADFQV